MCGVAFCPPHYNTFTWSGVEYKGGCHYSQVDLQEWQAAEGYKVVCVTLY